LETSSGKMPKTWIAHKAELAEELVLSRENALALTKIHQIQETEISKTSAQKTEAPVL